MDQPINILIVDDEPKNLTVLETVLDDPDYRLVRAESADEALLALVVEEFALLILDIRMPGMTGFELARMIKDRKKTARVPIIFLTAYYNEDQHVMTGYGSGAVDYLHKPVNAEILRSKVAVFAELHRKQRECLMVNRDLVAEVTERHRVEVQLLELNESLENRVAERTEALRASEDRFRSLAEGMPHCVWGCGITGANEYYNKAWYDYTGIAQNSGPSTDWIEFYHPDDQSHFREEWNKSLSSDGSQSFEVEVRIRRWDGTFRWFSVKGSPIRDDCGAIARWIGTCTDIHEQRSLLEDLREADRRKDEFLATLAHELRNPLSPITSAIALIKEGDVQLKDTTELVELADRHVRQLIRLVDDLLDVSRISRGKIDLQHGIYSLREITEQAVESASVYIRDFEHQLRLNLPIEDVFVFGDHARLVQVFTNLINNAAKYTPRAGCVSVSLYEGENSACFEVIDNGIGIPADGLSKVFELFTQLESSHASDKNGLGIGLALAKKLVELHGGSITIKSGGKGMGTQVSVCLPTREPPAKADTNDEDTTSSLSRSQTISSRRVVVVDDMRAITFTLGRLLEKLGHNVRSANSGFDALKLIDSFLPDVVFSDVSMPSMSGYELAGEIRSRFGKEICLVAMTGHGTQNDRQRCTQAGFDFHMVKPPNFEELTRFFHSISIAEMD